MELRELKYFMAVAKEESISKAAEALFITQPNLSRQMQNLEKEIGQPLFIRGSRRITLTDAGRLLYKRAEEIIELYNKTESE
ncbi:MAG: LysR family transcriptional regulator, partial [Anaeroplasmataceae bacterium]|nr:LysR family transcriptional regulator [Anaeroplasmataceae bacterium]